MSSPSISLSVKVIIRDPQGRVLLLQRSVKSRGNPGRWEFPGGKVDAEEAFDAALIREVGEETGLKIRLDEPFGTSESKLGRRHIVYLVMKATAEKTGVRLSEEHDAFQWLLPEEFGDVDFAPQFHRVAQRYAQDVAANAEPESAPAGGNLFAGSVVNPDTLKGHLAEFISKEKRLAEFAKFIETRLRTEVKKMIPTAEVSARAKDAVSFAGKLIKKDKYKDPLRQVTDLVGARVVVHLASEVDEVCRWIEKTFEVDPSNSGDKLAELGTEKFGYRSVHYVVEMRAGKPGGVPRNLVGLKAEIQVRTIAQHAWSDIGHDRIYKQDCEVPDYWKRQSNRISALLEAADEEFARLVKGLATYQDHIRHFPTNDAAERQIELWDVVRRKLPRHPQPALRVARVALDIQDWKKIIRVADEFKGAPPAELLAAKGYALCKTTKPSRTGVWRDGVRAMEQAAQMAGGKVGPLLQLGELHAGHDRDAALRYYEQAFARDPSHPEALVGYIRCKVLKQGSANFIPLLRPDIERAIKRSEELALAEADIPRCLYSIAGFLLLLGPEHSRESLAMLARAVHCTNPKAPDSLLQALKDLSDLAKSEPARTDIECARRFLAAAFFAKCRDRKWPADLDKPGMTRLNTKKPVIMVAGGCDAYHEKAMRSYAGLLEKAFATFSGTILCGGTTQGISGVVGALAAKSKGRICAVGYLPQNLPTDGTATKDAVRYKLRRTDRSDGGFTALEPIQSWLDLLAAGVHPSEVRLLGINGGNVAGLEYRIAVALGATVGVIEGSGREAECVAEDWPATRSHEPSGSLLVLPPDPTTLRAFIAIGLAQNAVLPADAVKQAAKLIHQTFLEEQRYRNPDPVMQTWAKLREDLKGSNLNQVSYLVEILRSEGFGVQPIPAGADAPSDPQFTPQEILRMGEKEHGRWNVERLASGWKYATKKDANRKRTPYLVPWAKLQPGIQKYDIQNVRTWPQILAEIGYEIFRK